MENEKSLTGYQRAVADLKVGDTVGIKSGTGKKKQIYRLEQVTKVTKAQVVLSRAWRFWKINGKEVDGLSYVEIMSTTDIRRWKAAKDKEERERELRQASYNPADHDDHVQAALRAMRDKARCLCEKLQAEVNDNLTRDPGGAMMPHWWAEYLQMLVQIEESEHALKSVGLSTTLKPSGEQRSLFR